MQYEKELLLLQASRHVGTKLPVQTAVTQDSRHTVPPLSLPFKPLNWKSTSPFLLYNNQSELLPFLLLLYNPPTPKFCCIQQFSSTSVYASSLLHSPPCVAEGLPTT